MNSKTILLTGATGFLGSHLAEGLSGNGYTVIAGIRDNSDLSRFKEFDSSNIICVKIDSSDFKETIVKYNPSVLVHAAWDGVAGEERNDEKMQMKNVVFVEKILNLAKDLGITKAISFGSQAEYGFFNGRIKEDVVCKPLTAYGITKLKALSLFKSFCELNSINWFWLRLFSVYGTREANSWLIPSVINNLFEKKSMDLTGCEQNYDYLYVKDFTQAIINVIESESDSGVFNLGSDSSMQLKYIIEKIKGQVDPTAVLNFGTLPYRENQVMHMEGNSEKFYRQFNFKISSEFDANIKEVVNYYKNK